MLVGMATTRTTKTETKLTAILATYTSCGELLGSLGETLLALDPALAGTECAPATVAAVQASAEYRAHSLVQCAMLCTTRDADGIARTTDAGWALIELAQAVREHAYGHIN